MSLHSFPPAVTPNEEYIIELAPGRRPDHGVPGISKRAKAAAGTATESSRPHGTGLVTEEDITRTVAAASNMEFVDLGQILVRPEIIDLIPRDKAYRYKAVPIALNDDVLVVAISDPLNFDTLDNLRFLLKREIETVCATPEQIKQALVKYYGSAEEAGDVLMGELGEGRATSAASTSNASADEDDRHGRFGHHQARFAAAAGGVQTPRERHSPRTAGKRFRVRFRIDGVLQEMTNPPKKLQSAIVSRLKIMSGTMSIAEKRLPQDGRIQVKMGKKSIDLRVSTIPTNHGESVVMRILDKSSLSLGLPELGFLTDDQAASSGCSCCPTASCSSPGRPVRARRRRFIPA